MDHLFNHRAVEEESRVVNTYLSNQKALEKEPSVVSASKSPESSAGVQVGEWPACPTRGWWRSLGMVNNRRSKERVVEKPRVFNVLPV